MTVTDIQFLLIPTKRGTTLYVGNLEECDGEEVYAINS
jgi:hypothetical protein